MEIKHKDIVIPSEDPFSNCKLNRKTYASILSNIIDVCSEGFVLAINNRWGTGKTTFVKMWKQYLENAGYKTIYLNAWENDLLTDPTVAILGELDNLIQSNEKDFKKLLDKTVIIAKSIFPTLGRAVVKHYVGDDVIEKITEKALTATSDLLEKEISEYSKKKENIEDFKKLLTDYVMSNGSGKPIVFIVDELDRCRPNYAVEVLERIKHFFSVNGIVFVLSIDKVQLGNSIRGFYGSDCIDSDEYLLRFIDIEYKLPEPDVKTFCQYLYDYFDFQSFFEDSRRQKHFGYEEKTQFIKQAIALANNSRLTLREIEKLFAHSRIALKTIDYNHQLSPASFFILIYLRAFHNNEYNKIKFKLYNIQDLYNFLELTLLDAENSSSNYYYIVELLVFYVTFYNFANGNFVLKLLDKEDNPTFSTRIDKADLKRFITSCDHYYRGENILKFFIERIELYSELIL